MVLEYDEICYEEVVSHYKYCKLSTLDRLLVSKGMFNEIFNYYRGAFTIGSLCKHIKTNKDEIHDFKDLVLPVNVYQFINGMEVQVRNGKLQKNTVFQKNVFGLFHKWEMESGVYFILSQKEVDTLTEKEKRNLRMKI